MVPAYYDDTSDMSRWVQKQPRTSKYHNRLNATLIHESLGAVDDAVARILEALDERVDNTILVFVSDNGNMLGAHQLRGKDVPYRRASEVTDDVQ